MRLRYLCRKMAHFVLQLQPETVYDVIKANVVLHNFVMTTEPMQIEDPEMPITLPSISMPDARSTRAVLQMRDYFSEYFLSGWVDWQDSMV